MSSLAWRLLSFFLEDAEKVYQNDHGRVYIASWHLAENLGGEATINGINVKIRPRNPAEAALRELIDLGIVCEMQPKLPERFRLVLKEASK